MVTDQRGNATGMHIERIGEIVGEYDTEANLVFTAPALNYNILSYNGVSVNGKKIDTANGTSPFLQVVRGYVSCVKPIPVYWDYTSGASIFIPNEIWNSESSSPAKKHIVIKMLKRKRRKRTRNGDTVNTRKVKWMKTYAPSGTPGRHVQRFRLYAKCRHWKSVYPTEVVYKRRSVLTQGEAI